MKTPQFMPGLLLGLYVLTIVLLYKRMSFVSLLVSLGVGALTQSVSGSVVVAAAMALFVLFAMVAIVPNEGFAMVMPLDPELRREMKKIEASTVEGFNTNTPPTEIYATVQSMKKKGFKEAFTDIAMNVQKAGFGIPGMKNVMEGYEDVNKEKNETPAPATKETHAPAMKKELAMPFTLGEIPAQVKNGPHIDAGSTLMKAMKALNPDQINSMTKDTQQLIETQKSLMGMLGTMKPMLNDGKQLMETFQQMFG